MSNNESHHSLRRELAAVGVGKFSSRMLHCVRACLCPQIETSYLASSCTFLAADRRKRGIVRRNVRQSRTEKRARVRFNQKQQDWCLHTRLILSGFKYERPWPSMALAHFCLCPLLRAHTNWICAHAPCAVNPMQRLR